jgi:hypothetical protein
MQVKGTSVLATRNFVAERFGEKELQRWIADLPQGSQPVFSQTILASAWYPFQEAFVRPTRLVCQRWFHGTDHGAREIGRYSAEQSLKGIYRAFARVASVNYMLEKTAGIFKTYYTPGEMRVAERDQNRIVMQITGLDETDPLFESRICGWITGALYVCNNKVHKVEVARSLTRGQGLTEIVISL